MLHKPKVVVKGACIIVGMGQKVPDGPMRATVCRELLTARLSRSRLGGDNGKLLRPIRSPRETYITIVCV